jgi:phosphodiesterase/alkaline phosphatase D-like protein
MTASGLAHGPMLGNITSRSVRVWVRTRSPLPFQILFSELADLGNHRSVQGRTRLEHDNTGWVQLQSLKSNTKYYYAVRVTGRTVDTRVGGAFNSFTTLPDRAGFIHPDHNPRGLFNFNFEFGCGNRQAHPKTDTFPSDPVVFETILKQHKDKIHFHIANGDWLYEDVKKRAFTPEQWAAANSVMQIPKVARLAYGIVGVWENYKLYLSRSTRLANYHREVPFFVTFDDHEIWNDVIGSGEIGFCTDMRGDKADVSPWDTSKEAYMRRAVFRDPALQAWSDYLSWSNPDIGIEQPIHFGTAEFKANSNILFDPNADFTTIDLNKSASLHILIRYANTGVYRIKRIIDKTRLEIHPPPAYNESADYSIGTNHYTRFTIGNCEFYLLDTRSFRTFHGSRHAPYATPSTMIGDCQFQWLVSHMKTSDADFFFVVSPVNFAVAHRSGTGNKAGDKDDAWTAQMKERDRLIKEFISLKKPVFVLTGDLHNCFVVQVAPGVWEFASGAHNSPSHRISDAGGAPISGWFQSGKYRAKVKWSTGFLDDVPRHKNHFPRYCIVQVNNVFSAPDIQGHARWVAYPAPQVIFRYYNGVTGDLLYAESVSTLDCQR